jgi:iron complex transport system ATP-binding protein
VSFQVRNASFHYPRADHPAVRGISLDIPSGCHAAIVGPNGAGKTTLARLLLGLIRPERGSATFAGRPATAWPRREIARRIGVVAQEAPPSLPISVREYVEMGRNPYVRAWAPLRSEDRRHVMSALRRADLEPLEERSVTELSGGEVQRAKLARAFAQAPETLVLDEPTAHLDIAHEMAIFRLVREFVDAGGSAVTITHSLHLASRFADLLFLLDDGVLAASGAPPEVLRPEILSRVFGWPLEVVALGHPEIAGLHIVPLDSHGGREGEPGAEAAKGGSP